MTSSRVVCDFVILSHFYHEYGSIPHVYTCLNHAVHSICFGCAQCNFDCSRMGVLQAPETGILLIKGQVWMNIGVGKLFISQKMKNLWIVYPALRPPLSTCPRWLFRTGSMWISPFSFLLQACKCPKCEGPLSFPQPLMKCCDCITEQMSCWLKWDWPCQGCTISKLEWGGEWKIIQNLWVACPVNSDFGVGRDLLQTILVGCNTSLEFGMRVDKCPTPTSILLNGMNQIGQEL